MPIEQGNLIQSYMTKIGLTGRDRSPDLINQIQDMYDSMIQMHYCRYAWPFLEYAEKTLTYVLTDVDADTGSEYFPVTDISFITSVRIGTTGVVATNTIIPIAFDFYNLLRLQAQANSDIPEFVAKKQNRLYPYPMPDTVAAKLIITGIKDFDNSLGGGAQTIQIPDRHKQALLCLIDFNLGVKSIDEYEKQIAILGGAEAIDFWEMNYAAH